MDNNSDSSQGGASIILPCSESWGKGQWKFLLWNKGAVSFSGGLPYLTTWLQWLDFNLRRDAHVRDSHKWAPLILSQSSFPPATEIPQSHGQGLQTLQFHFILFLFFVFCCDYSQSYCISIVLLLYLGDLPQEFICSNSCFGVSPLDEEVDISFLYRTILNPPSVLGCWCAHPRQRIRHIGRGLILKVLLSTILQLQI